MKKVVIFDAYGTLFDVNAAARNYSKETADINFINTWEKVSKLWRDKQIAYTWYYTSIRYKTNFWKVTEDSLEYALEFYNLKDNKNIRHNLLKLYRKCLLTILVEETSMFIFLGTQKLFLSLIIIKI